MENSNITRILIINSNSLECKNDIIKPFIQFAEIYPSFKITIKNTYHLSYSDYDKYDYVVFDGCINGDYDYTIDLFRRYATLLVGRIGQVEEPKKPKFIYYVSEWWQLPKNHPLYKKYNEYEIHDKIKTIIMLSNAILTYGNDLLVEEIKSLNENVIQIKQKNGYNEIMCNTNKPVLGVVPNEYDLNNIKLLSCIHERFNKTSNFWNHIQLVLVGFTNKELKYDKIEKIHVETPSNNNIWIQYEKIITNNYSICSPDYKEFLLKFIPNSNYKGNIDNEPYKRIWKQDVSDDTIYYNILLRPTEKNKFNELKYSREESLSKNTVINGKYVEVINSIDVSKISTKKVLRQRIIESILKFRENVLFPIEHINNDCLIELRVFFHTQEMKKK